MYKESTGWKGLLKNRSLILKFEEVKGFIHETQPDCILCLALCIFFFFNFNNDVLFLWCQLGSCNIAHGNLIGMTTNFTNSVIPRERKKELRKKIIKNPQQQNTTPEVVKP